MPHGGRPPSRIVTGRIPYSLPGMRIGLFGGSFNPPHAGHRHVALTAMKRLKLDQIWWLVTPGNPLKDHSSLASAAERLQLAAQMASHPRMIVTDVETTLGTRYSIDSLTELKRRLPGRRLVFVLGADNWATFHRWQKWHDILALMPVAVPDRPGSTMAALNSPAARFARHRQDKEPARLMDLPQRGWAFLAGRKVPLSSTQLRKKNDMKSILPPPQSRP